MITSGALVASHSNSRLLGMFGGGLVHPHVGCGWPQHLQLQYTFNKLSKTLLAAPICPSKRREVGPNKAAAASTHIGPHGHNLPTDRTHMIE
jgi:hypothetical protein